jgi:hypothetical protein
MTVSSLLQLPSLAVDLRQTDEVIRTGEFLLSNFGRERAFFGWLVAIQRLKTSNRGKF